MIYYSDLTTMHVYVQCIRFDALNYYQTLDIDECVEGKHNCSKNARCKKISMEDTAVNVS